MRNTFFMCEKFSSVINPIKRIMLKGRDEQELQILFPSLYGNKAITKQTKGAFKNHYRSNHNYIKVLTF